MSKTILVVDDDAIIRRVCRAGLEANGYRVIELVEGSKVIKTIKQEGVDLVILDIFMDGQEGMETAFMLLREHEDIPVIMISSDADYLEQADMIVQATIQKPINISVLKETVENLL